MTRPWSIERRLFHWIAGSATVMALVYAIATVWMVTASLHDELDTLAAEEIEEMEAEVRGRTLDLEALRATLRAIGEDHPGYRFYWQVWVPDRDPAVLALGGASPVDLPATWSAAEALEPTPTGATRWMATEIASRIAGEVDADALRVGMLIDARPRRASARNATALVLGAIALTALTATVGGWLLTRKAGRTLRDAADRARDLDALRREDPLTDHSAPVEVQRVAAALRASLSELRQQHSTNLLLTAGMAHELRSPLQNMMSETSVALLRERTPEEYREVLGSQLDEMHDLRRTVDNLITLTALRERGALERKERVQLGAEAELRLAKEAEAAERRGITFEIDRDGDLELDGDREALLLMLRNIVDNAIRCAPDGGRVELHLNGDDSSLTACVDDDGPGVPPELREAIFQAFEQAPARDGSRGSYGLGLALARGAAEAHGGTITVGDSPLGGARFEVVLPKRG